MCCNVDEVRMLSFAKHYQRNKSKENFIFNALAAESAPSSQVKCSPRF
jgi:hypothetical protein